MKILVTGATGHLGSLVAEKLLQDVPKGNLAVSVRQPDKAESLRVQGVDVRYGDFDKPETLDKAFAGVDRLLIISTEGDNDSRIRQHKAAVNAAERAGVGFIAYTSVINADDNPLLLAPVHRATEEAIRQANIPYSFLRNNWYLENEASAVQGVLNGVPWLTSAGTGRVGWAARRDYAHAAAAVLTGDGHENTVYELSGKLLTHEELAALLAEVLERPVSVKHVTDDVYADTLKAAGLPEWLIHFLTSIQGAIREGALDLPSNDFEKLLDRPLTPVHDVFREMIRNTK